MRQWKRKTIVRALDKVTAEIIKVRDDYQCQRCAPRKAYKIPLSPKPRGLHWAHIYGRSNYAMRWDLLNSLCLCCGCHRWGHANPLDFQHWFRITYPARYQYLITLRKVKPKPIRDSELKELLTHHRQKLKELKEELQKPWRHDQ